MKTITDRTNDLCDVLRAQGSSINPVAYERMMLILRELAKDQRHLCAETIAGMESKRHGLPKDNCINKHEAHQAVMNAGIE